MSRTAKQRRHAEIQRMREGYTKENRIGEFYEHMTSIFADRSNSLEDWSLRGLFESLVDDGRELVEHHFGGEQGGFSMREASDVVNTALFANITGNYVYNAILRAFEMPELIGDRLVTIMPSSEQTERIPGVAPLGDQAEVVAEGAPYGRAVTQERWVDTPTTVKRGLIVDITKEILFFDKTGQVLIECRRVGEFLAINRERRILDAVLGISTIYRRNGQAAVATYGSDNTSASTPLVDWTSVDTVNLKLMGLTDPDTGDPISIMADSLIVPPALEMTANRIRAAVQTSTVYQPNAASGTANNNRETWVNGNSVKRQFEVLSNQYVKERTSSDTSWFWGAPKRAFAYVQNWPLGVTALGDNSYLSFERDVVSSYKASERGTPAVIERLQNAKATA